MQDLILLIAHFITLPFRLLRPGGLNSVAAENLLLKRQLLIIRRPKTKAPNLSTSDRFILGWLAMLLTPNRLVRSAVILKPATLLTFHKTLVRRKYRLLFPHTHKGPNSDLIKAVVEINRRNPRSGCPCIALMISNMFGIENYKDVVRHILIKHYHPGPGDRGGPSLLSFLLI